MQQQQQRQQQTYKRLVMANGQALYVSGHSGPIQFQGGQRRIITSGGVPVVGMIKKPVNSASIATNPTATAVQVVQALQASGNPGPMLIPQKRSSTPATPQNSNKPEPSGSGSGSGETPPPVKRKIVQMRLRCRTRPQPLQAAYFENQDVVDRDADVLFQCGDGGRVRAHRVLLASTSTFFTDLFKDQPIGEISVVSVLDVTSDLMKLVVLLCYKTEVIINAEQLQKLSGLLKMFGINFIKHFTPEPIDDGHELDAMPGNKLTESVSTPRCVYPNAEGALGIKRKMTPSFTPEQIQKLKQYKNGPGSDDVGNVRGHRIETETDESNETDGSHLPEADEHMIEEWMAKVGRSSAHGKPSQGGVRMECAKCSAGFTKKEAWKWHQDRHVGYGLFSCQLCPVKKTSAHAIWNHEQSIHKFIGIPYNEVKEDPRFGNRATPGTSSTSINSPNAMRFAQLKKVKGVRMGAGVSGGVHRHLSRPFPTPNQNIKEGPVDMEDMDVRKIKQLHWLYVCGKCDNVSDSLGKAQIHFNKCYPDGDTTFEDTVMKYRQGFYGKSKCPLCPRKYVANGGWVIHTGHQHPEYRKMFTHTGNVEDKLKCVHCLRKYASPEEFHLHLNNFERCTNMRVAEESGGTPGGRDNAVAGPTDKVATEGKKASPPKKPQTPPVVYPPPKIRSARLASRHSAMLMAKVLSFEKQDDENTAPSKRRPSNQPPYPPVDCPVCGNEVPFIAQHLSVEHPEIRAHVNRISSGLFRCRACLITFDICDLLSHLESCDKGKSSTIVHAPPPAPPRPPPEPKKAPEQYEIPEDVGISAVDRMDISLQELGSKNIVFKIGLVCPVCKRKSLKLGDTGKCLLSHGIFRCSLCLNTYRDRGDYHNHQKTMHFNTSGKPRCPLCPQDRVFINTGQCVGHMYSQHWCKEGGKPAAEVSVDPPAPKPEEMIENAETTPQPQAQEDEGKGEEEIVKNDEETKEKETVQDEEKIEETSDDKEKVVEEEPTPESDQKTPIIESPTEPQDEMKEDNPPPCNSS